MAFDDEREYSMNSASGSNSSNDDVSSTCLVCKQKAHGIHFGVVTCRACAAFFRRTMVKNLKYSCKHENISDLCDMNLDAKSDCKLCRFMRCQRVGMTTNNIQLNRDCTPATNVIRSKPKTKTFTGTKQEPVSIDKPPVIIKNLKQTKFSYLHDRLNSIFNLELMCEIVVPSLLVRLEQHLTKQRTAVSRSPEYVTEMRLQAFLPFQGDQKCMIAEWMMACPDFAKLENDEKWRIYESRWQQMYVLEKIHMSAMLFGDMTVTDNLLLLSNTYYGSRNEFHMDTSSISDHDPEYVDSVLNPFCKSEDIVRTIVGLSPTPTEIAYMLAQTMWNVEELVLCPETIDTADRVRDRLSAELHVYYTTEENTPNYADRLNRLMNVVQTVKNHVRNHNQVIELATLFDVFKIKEETITGFFAREPHDTQL